MKNKFSKILNPYYIGDIKVRNRIAMAPMTTLYAGHDGQVTEQLIEYYAARAKGGAGMITVEGAYVNETGLQIPASINVSDDKFIPGLSRIADGIKDNGSVAVLQLIHSGIQAWVKQSVGPSEIGRIDGKPISTESTPRALTAKETAQFVEDFAQAARRAKMAGFDMVQVHGTHGYLIMQFLSPKTNKRIDNYGVDRNLFPVEIVRAIKATCGDNYPVIFRLCADESLGDPNIIGGITIEDAKITAKVLEEAGVDAFEVTGGTDDVIHLYVPSAYILDGNEGVFKKYAKEIKKVVKVPIITGGGVNTPKAVEEMLDDGSIDAVFIGRQLIADPDWVNKVSEGRTEDIRPCVKCVECGSRIVFMKCMRCSINPLSGIEWKYLNEKQIPFARDKKKILIIGGGPAGLEVARTAVLRGHEVTIVEKNNQLGGTINTASVPSFKSRFSELKNWYVKQLEDLKIKLVLGKKADVNMIKEINADVVIVTTGSEDAIPDIPGIGNTVLSTDVLLQNAEVGEKVIIIGGGFVGAETALHLAKQHKKVTVFEASENPEFEISGVALLRKGGLFDQYGVKYNLNTPIVEIYEGKVLTIGKLGKKIYTEADTIINAIGRKPVVDEKIIEYLKAEGKKYFIVGDAKRVRKVTDALHEAFQVAMSI